MLKSQPHPFGGSGRYRQLVTITNRTRETIAGPVSLVLDNLSGNVVLVNRTGTTACAPAGSPYINLNVGQDNSLRPLETRFLLLEFTAPNTSSITYSTRVLGGSGPR